MRSVDRIAKGAFSCAYACWPEGHRQLDPHSIPVASPKLNGGRAADARRRHLERNEARSHIGVQNTIARRTSAARDLQTPPVVRAFDLSDFPALGLLGTLCLIDPLFQ
jgi:hypothetical protein